VGLKTLTQSINQHLPMSSQWRYLWRFLSLYDIGERRTKSVGFPWFEFICSLTQLVGWRVVQ